MGKESEWEVDKETVSQPLREKPVFIEVSMDPFCPLTIPMSLHSLLSFPFNRRESKRPCYVLEESLFWSSEPYSPSVGSGIVVHVYMSVAFLPYPCKFYRSSNNFFIAQGTERPGEVGCASVEERVTFLYDRK